MPGVPAVNPPNIAYEMAALGKRGVSFITDLPADAYESDDRVTIIVASVLGSVAVLAVVVLLIFGVIRRNKRRAARLEKGGPLSDDECSDEEDEVPAPAPQQQRQQKAPPA
ncbi:hypothetical protein H4R19_005809, partial [Coemansia spiralis]